MPRQNPYYKINTLNFTISCQAISYIQHRSANPPILMLQTTWRKQGNWTYVEGWVKAFSFLWVLIWSSFLHETICPFWHNICGKPKFHIWNSQVTHLPPPTLFFGSKICHRTNVMPHDLKGKNDPTAPLNSPELR